MALRPPPKKNAPAPSQEDIERVISGGNVTRGDRPAATVAEQIGAAEPVKDVSFTMTIPPKLAALIDAHRAPSKTSRRAWLLQAAEDRLRRDGLI